MVAFLKLLFENETAVLAILGLLFVCYYKSLKYIVLSNCTKINLLCCLIEKKPMSDTNITEMMRTPETQHRSLGDIRDVEQG